MNAGGEVAAPLAHRLDDAGAVGKQDAAVVGLQPPGDDAVVVEIQANWHGRAREPGPAQAGRIGDRAEIERVEAADGEV
jgi:hypothetical protein